MDAPIKSEHDDEERSEHDDAESLGDDLEGLAEEKQSAITPATIPASASLFRLMAEFQSIPKACRRNQTRG